jgi:uncharacterized protein
MDELWKPDRRAFMRRGAMGAGAMWALSLGELSARAGHRGPVVVSGVSPYGPITPIADQTTGLPLLKLPRGFKYWSHSWTGDTMSDGVARRRRRPFRRAGSDRDDDDDDVGSDRSSKGRGDSHKRKGPDRLVLVRNHEGSGGAPYIANRPDITYAPPGKPTGSGGTTNLIFDPIGGKWAGYHLRDHRTVGQGPAVILAPHDLAPLFGRQVSRRREAAHRPAFRHRRERAAAAPRGGR